MTDETLPGLLSSAETLGVRGLQHLIPSSEQSTSPSNTPLPSEDWDGDEVGDGQDKDHGNGGEGEKEDSNKRAHEDHTQVCVGGM